MAAEGEKVAAKSVRLDTAGEPGALSRQDRAGSSNDSGLAVDSPISEEKARHSDSEVDETAELRLENGVPDPKDDRRPQQDRRVSTFAKTATVVPRSQRRGLFGRFSIIPEIESPYEYTRKTKWIITAIVALAAAASPMGSGIFYRK